MKKLCLFCRHFNVEGPQRGWSDVTPGSDTFVGCYWREHWQVDESYTTWTFNQKMKMAETCEDFEPQEYYLEYIND